MIAILRDITTSKHVAVWAVDSEHGQDAVAVEANQEVITWPTDMPTYHERARQLAGGDYSACFGATPSEMTAEPTLPEEPVGVDLVAEEFEKYVVEKSLTLLDLVKIEDMSEVLRRAKAREGAA